MPNVKINSSIKGFVFQAEGDAQTLAAAIAGVAEQVAQAFKPQPEPPQPAAKAARPPKRPAK